MNTTKIYVIETVIGIFIHHTVFYYDVMGKENQAIRRHLVYGATLLQHIQCCICSGVSFFKK